MNEALAALDTIKEADINYIKKLGNPPGAIKLVLEAVCVILDAKPAKVKDESGKMVNDYWKPSVALMNEKVGSKEAEANPCHETVWVSLRMKCKTE